MEHNKLQLTIQLNLAPEAMRKHGITLEKALDWVKLSGDAVVDGFLIRVSGPSDVMAQERFHLPGGFYGVKSTGICNAEHSEFHYEILRAGNPFHYIEDEGDIVRLANSLIQHTQNNSKHTLETQDENSYFDPTRTIEYPHWNTVLGKCETALLCACCFYLVHACQEEDHNLCCVLKLLNSAYEDNSSEPLTKYCVLDILFRDLEMRDPDDNAITYYNSFLHDFGFTTAQLAVESCIERIENMTLAQLNSVISDLKSH